MSPRAYGGPSLTYKLQYSLADPRDGGGGSSRRMPFLVQFFFHFHAFFVENWPK